MINLLVFLEVLKELVLIGLIIDVSKPCDREHVTFGLLEIILFECDLNQPGVTFDHLEHQMVLLLIPI